jgi:Ca-activated chloride channel family protein
MNGICGALLLLNLGAVPASVGPSQPLYTLPVQVDEVNVIFSASDFEGRPINDLELSDMRLMDDGKRQTKIVKFEHPTDLPLRAGILVDISGSMSGESNFTRLAVALFAGRILRSTSDKAFIMRFASMQKLMQDWTSSTEELREASPPIGVNWSSLGIRTAIYDSLYIAVKEQFAKKPTDTTGTANAILLFSDGADDASHATLQDVMDICQQTNSRIYAFYSGSRSRFGEGQKNLRNLAAGTGGRVFYNDDSANALANLRLIENDLRNHYLLVYKPSNLKNDGRFHAIRLTSPTRGGVIATRSGYYAPRKTANTSH